MTQEKKVVESTQEIEAIEKPENDKEVRENAKIVVEHNHPIAQAINKFLHRARDIKSAAQIHIPLSVKRKKQRFTEVAKTFEDAHTLSKEEKDKASQILRNTKTIDAFRKLERLLQSNVPEILETSLFLGLFSAFDAFTGDLLKAIYSKKPELFNKLNREVLLSDILKYNSFDEMKNNVLMNEIESFRRNSYVEQFESLEKDFGLPLKKFERWSNFVECGQRRNLITHNDGFVNEQYIKVCSKEGYVFSDLISIGDKLELNPNYFLDSCELLMEVAFKLGQTLWRKIFPDEISDADEHAIEVIYDDCLQTESWERAIIFADFIDKQKELSSDEKRKINKINLTIALKFSGKSDEAINILSSTDWSGSSSDFKLAEAVLIDKFDDAVQLMERIGEKGEIISEDSYHRFPLFREFRNSEQFLKTYEKIYGYPFAVQLQRKADKKQVEATKAIKNQNEEIETLSNEKSRNNVQKVNQKNKRTKVIRLTKRTK